MNDENLEKAIRKAAARLDMEPAFLLALAEVESGGRAFATVNGRPEPLIRFEGHYFDARLSGDKREQARKAGLASPTPGAVRNPASQADRWRLLAEAAAIDHLAAHESVSWGIGQVMGAHWKWLGFASVDELVAEARGGVEGQMRLMMRYVERAGLADAVQRRDWEAFARAYNGPGYAANAYHLKIAEAYERHAGTGGAASASSSAGRSSATRRKRRQPPSDDSRDLQRMLSEAGYPVAVDGIVGPATRQAIRSFQADHGLGVDGIAGPRTRAALHEALAKRAGVWRSLARAVMRLFARWGRRAMRMDRGGPVP